MNESTHERHWQVLYSEPGPKLPLFQTRCDWVKNPRNGQEFKAIILESPDWVNVVAITPQQTLLMVRQHRFGIGTVTTEIPAGMIDPGETSHQAAMRELCEETGCTSDDWQYLGWVEANPAFLNNRCHLWLARNVRQTHTTEQDLGENVAIIELTLDEIHQEIASGRMRNAFTILALSQIFNLRPGFES